MGGRQQLCARSAAAGTRREGSVSLAASGPAKAHAIDVGGWQQSPSSSRKSQELLSWIAANDRARKMQPSTEVWSPRSAPQPAFPFVRSLLARPWALIRGVHLILHCWE